MRRLVTIRTVGEIEPIPGADAIEVANVDGWKIVVKKGEYITGHPCVYFEIDSFLPLTERFEFLRARCHKRMGDQEGLRLKTIKLRGQVSQGLLMRLSEFPEITAIADSLPEDYSSSEVFEYLASLDLSELLDVQKYEPPVPAALAGQISGNFPGFIKKTDQERCQNLGYEIFVDNKDSCYEVTMKMDGTSFTAFHRDDEDGVCGRNWQLKLDETNEHNTLVRMYVDSGLQAALRKIGGNYAVQGELMGPGIQKNRESLKEHHLFVFDIYDIDNGCYLAPHARLALMDMLYPAGLNSRMVTHVPFMHDNVTLAELGITNTAELLAFAEGPSFNHPVREGLVFKRIDGRFSFKAISNLFLLKED